MVEVLAVVTGACGTGRAGHRMTPLSEPRFFPCRLFCPRFEMRLNCWTQVGYRMMEAQNPNSKKAAFTVLVLSRPPARNKSSNPVTYILVCTPAKPSGAKYRVTMLFNNFNAIDGWNKRLASLVWCIFALPFECV